MAQSTEPKLSNEKMSALLNLVLYRNKLDELYALGVEANLGLSYYNKSMSERENDARASDGILPENRTIFYGTENPNSPLATYQHKATFHDVLERTSKNGTGNILLYQAIIVFAYTHWEDTTRGHFAKAIGINKNDVSSQIYSDLAKYRNSIAHNNGILKKAPETLKYISKGEPINLTQKDFQNLFSELIFELSSIASHHLNINYPFEFSLPMNPVK